MRESPRRIGRLSGVVVPPAGLTPGQRGKLLACMKACPVSRSLHPDIKLDFKFR